MKDFRSILRIFKSTLGVPAWECPPTYQEQYEKLISAIETPAIDYQDMVDILLRVVVDKLDLYREKIQKLYDDCAHENVFFNYIEKQQIKTLFISRVKDVLSNILLQKGMSKNAVEKMLSFPFYTDEEILGLFRKEVISDKKLSDILESLLSSFLYNLFPEDTVHSYNSHTSSNSHNFYGFLREEFPNKYSRSHSLAVLHVTDRFYKNYSSYQEFLSAICGFVKDQYSILQNYCYMAIIVDPLQDQANSIQWKFYSDIVLYAEKHIEEKLSIGYFHPEKIKEQTMNYIEDLDVESADFAICNTGFTYKDCFIIAAKDHSISENEIYEDYNILILFQKNERDEDVIPCPRCRSYNVRGNSYPTLGVKSWECHNLLCPDKSKYNRGKRYSLSQIIKQEAIEDERSQIDAQTLKNWHLDVVNYKTISEIVSYLIKEYTFWGDDIYLYNICFKEEILEGRKAHYSPFIWKPMLSSLEFYNSAYFKRFMVEKKCKPVELDNISTFNNHLVYNNDCQDVLSTLEDVSVDGAVTSPPYYNARDYSHWDNIYCYLYDMYNHARGIYKVLKPGSYYLYNIFDYFDNENNVVFSAMGKKRLILGSYIIRMFTQIGFEITQNIIWYKGQIQGNRATNQGNNSPYYQAPLNCYEHILCFRKPSSVVKKISFPQIINVFPVVKIVKGENVLGHTAPFPHEIPDLLSSRIKGVIIDPYSGSFTTARSAEAFHLKSISVEKSKVYCDLGLKLLKKSVSSSQPLFFDFGKEWGAYAQEDLGSIEDDLSHTGS